MLNPLISRSSGKHLRVVALKPNKDLSYTNELCNAGRLVPVIDRRYEFTELPDAFRFFATGDHKGKIVITMG